MRNLKERFNLLSYLVNDKEINPCIQLRLKKTQRGGHTIIHVGNKNKQAHRVAWELGIGEIAKGMQINHLCNNPRCVNITHLYMGNQKENIQDCIKSGRFPWANLKRNRPNPTTAGLE